MKSSKLKNWKNQKIRNEIKLIKWIQYASTRWVDIFIVLYDLISMIIIRDIEKVEKRCKIPRSHFDDMTSEQKMNRKDWINKW